MRARVRAAVRAGEDELEAGDGAFGALAEVLEPEDAEGEDAVDGGGGFFVVDGDDGEALGGAG